MIRLFHTACDEAEIAVAAEVLRSGDLILGEQVEGFERELAAFIDAPAANLVTCGSGTDALMLALDALNLGHAQAIVPAMTFSATGEAVVRLGGRLRVTDVDPRTLMLSAAIVHGALRTCADARALILVHLHGWPCPDTAEIAELCNKAGVALIEDCCQAFGASLDGLHVGTLGAAAAFSFYPTKPLGGIGDGGAVLFREPAPAAAARALRNHGKTAQGQVRPGINSRLDAVNAAVLRHRLARFWHNKQQRLAIAARYAYLLGDSLDTPCSPYVWPLRLAGRDAVAARLRKAGIETGIHYDPPLAALPWVNNGTGCPVAVTAARELLSLPCHHGLTSSDAETVAAALRTIRRAAA